MRFVETTVAGAFIVEPRKIEDARGFFARAWCQDTFHAAGLDATIKQCNLAVSNTSGTLRGLHFQRPPFEEVKVLRCVKGAIFDVVVDLRRGSPTYRRWFGAELNDSNHLALYVPAGCATGYLTRTDGATIYYHASEVFDRDSAHGIRFDDPSIDIKWPEPPQVISDQDRAWPYLSPDGD